MPTDPSPTAHGAALATRRPYSPATKRCCVATTGDANNVKDSASVPAEKLIVACSFRIPGLGNVAMFMQSTEGLAVCVAVPVALLLAYDIIRRRAYDLESQAATAALEAELAQLSIALHVTLVGNSVFSPPPMTKNISHAYAESDGDDVRTTGKQLALVLTPKAGANLPDDARISVNGTEYAKNAAGNFIVPLGTVASGAASLSLVSSMMNATGGSFDFDASLMPYAGESGSPMAGAKVASASVTPGVAAQVTASIKVTGTRVAHKSEWANGEDFAFGVTKPDDAMVAVSAYNGLSLNTSATNLLSSVGDVFEVNGGTGTYTGGTPNGKLVLSAVADAGTYRLVSDVTAADGIKLASTTYYVIMRN